MEVPTILKTVTSDSSLASQAYALVLDQMMQGKLPVGSVLSRRKLAEEFKMSLVPVAQALQRLEIEGIVESRPRAGTRVKAPSADEIRARFELREALECQSARLCAERATFGERLELRRLAANLDILFTKAASQGPNDDSGYAVNECHANLHMRIAAFSRSEFLNSAIQNNHVLIFNWLYDTAAGRRRLPDNFHKDLIAAIVQGNPREAEDVMRGHVIYGLKAIQDAIEPLRGGNWRLKRQSGLLTKTA